MMIDDTTGICILLAGRELASQNLRVFHRNETSMNSCMQYLRYTNSTTTWCWRYVLSILIKTAMRKNVGQSAITLNLGLTQLRR